MGIIERLKAQDSRLADLERRSSGLEAALNELLASLAHEESDEAEPALISTLDGVTYQSRDRDQGEPL